jgi:hypothetical protein
VVKKNVAVVVTRELMKVNKANSLHIQSSHAGIGLQQNRVLAADGANRALT